MQGRRTFGFFGLLAVVLLTVSGRSYGLDPSDLDLHGMKDGFQKETRVLKGAWQGEEKWKGTLCDGYYKYDANLGALLDTLDFELNDDGTIGVYGDLRDVFSAAKGTYRSQATLCIPLRGWTAIGADRAEIYTEARFEGDSQELNSVKLRVISTKLSGIHLGKLVPAWFERFIGNVLNRALSWVWASKLGEWISDQISDIIKKKIPSDALVPARSGYRR